MSMRVYTRVVWEWRDGKLVETEAKFYDYDGPVALAHTNPYVVQNHFRFRVANETVDGTPTWIASEDTNVNIDVSSGNVKFVLRVAIQETAGVASSSWTWAPRSSLDGYAAVLTTASTGVRFADSSADAHNTAVTVSRLTGSGSFTNGRLQEDYTGVSSVSIVASGYTEMEWGLELVAADLTDGQIIDFRCYGSNNLLDSYAVTPRITVSKNPAFGSLIGSAFKGIAAGVSTTLVAQKIPVSVGDLAVLWVIDNCSTSAINISDALGNSFSNITSKLNNANKSCQAFYSKITTAGDMAITATCNNNTNAKNLHVLVFKGTWTSSPLDVTQSDTAGSINSPYDCPASGTLAQADELVLAFCELYNTQTTAPSATSPFTLVDWGQSASSGTSNLTGISKKIVSSTDTVTPQFTATNSSGQSILVTASFKELVEAPGSPTNLIATAMSSSEIDLDWDAPTSGGTPTGYKIERESPIGGGWGNLVANTQNTDTAYSDTSCQAETQYNYRVSALNSAGNSSPSTADDATTPEAALGIGVLTGSMMGPPYF